MLVRCPVCETEKPSEDFHKNNARKNGLDWRCKNCSAESKAENYRKNPERARAYAVKWRKNNPARHRASRYKWAQENPEKVKQTALVLKQNSARQKKYGLCPHTFQRLLTLQENKCGICQEDLISPCVDHCHVTGRVRGLLCRKCNSGIGQLNDSAERCERAAVYLRTGT